MERFLAASRSFSKPNDFIPNYGTAGFRANATVLPSTVFRYSTFRCILCFGGRQNTNNQPYLVLFRCGVLMALRAMKTGKVAGICITASHNPVDDNGVKLVEPSGEMLCQQWEVSHCKYHDCFYVITLHQRMYTTCPVVTGALNVCRHMPIN